jgi:hypothetical protein
VEEDDARANQAAEHDVFLAFFNHGFYVLHFALVNIDLV